MAVPHLHFYRYDTFVAKHVYVTYFPAKFCIIYVDCGYV